MKGARSSRRGSTIVNEAPEKAMDADKVGHESVKVAKPQPEKK